MKKKKNKKNDSNHEKITTDKDAQANKKGGTKGIETEKRSKKEDKINIDAEKNGERYKKRKTIREYESSAREKKDN